MLDLPELKVNISSSGSTEVGQKLNITCSVTLVDGLKNLTIKWDKPDGITELIGVDLVQVRTSDGPVTKLTLILDPVLFNHKGVYICMAEYNITVTDDFDSLSKSHVLVVNCKFQMDLNLAYIFTLNNKLIRNCGYAANYKTLFILFLKEFLIFHAAYLSTRIFIYMSMHE